MIKLKFSVPVLLIFLSSFAYGQSANTSRKEALDIKRRVLLIPIVKGKGKKNSEMFQQLVKKYWTFNESIEYVPAAKVKGMMKKDKAKYALLTYSVFTEWAIRKTRNPLYNERSKLMRSKYTRDPYVANTIATLMITLNGRKSLIKTNLSANYSLERNTIYGLMQLQYLLNYLVENPKHRSLATFYRRQAPKNGPELKNKTLLIDKELLSKKLDIAKIKDYYPFPYKLADAPMIDEALKTRSDQYAFIHIASIESGRGAMHIQFISSTKDGKIYLYVAPRAFSIAGLNGIKFRQFHKIGKKQLKRYAKKVK
ncbi:hypothetical protein BKI52_24830 [marine bacterium AO1-C]|nr:hypothetical protein BKI52_24830 [marine bacterium AO1-C]